MSLYIFVGFIFLIAIQRLFELRLSNYNEAIILRRGGREHAPGHFIVMKLIHLCWLIAMPLEVYFFHRQFSIYVFILALVLTLAGQALRYGAIRTLKDRWTVRIMTLPHAPPVTDGIFRYIRHPNYLGVVFEIFAIPLLHSAYLSSLIFSLANGLLLIVRIRAEEHALGIENNYQQHFSNKSAEQF